jgi:hypothetical protein
VTSEQERDDWLGDDHGRAYARTGEPPEGLWRRVVPHEGGAMSWGEWLNTVSGGVTMLGLWITLAAFIIGGWSSRTAKRLQADIHAATQLTLTDMRKSFQESQQVLGEAVKGVGEAVKAVGDGVTQLGQILERMDQRTAQLQARQDETDQRWQEAFERMDQRADERHREFLQGLATLRGS